MFPTEREDRCLSHIWQRHGEGVPHPHRQKERGVSDQNREGVKELLLPFSRRS